MPLYRRVSLLIPEKRTSICSFYRGSIAYQKKNCPQDTFSLRSHSRHLYRLKGRFFIVEKGFFTLRGLANSD